MMILMVMMVVLMMMLRCDILVRLAKWRVQWGIYWRHHHSNLWTYADADSGSGSNDDNDDGNENHQADDGDEI